MATPLVVGAAILDDLARPAALLTARRSAPKSLAGAWEFPGGKVEPGESPLDALQRELFEELGIAVVFGEEVVAPDGASWPIHHGHRMRVWTAQITEGSPLPLADHDEVRWLDAGDWYAVSWLPADLPIVGALRELVERPAAEDGGAGAGAGPGA